MRLELVEEDAVRDGFVTVEPDLLVPARSTCVEVQVSSRSPVGDELHSQAGPFIGWVLMMTASFRCRRHTLSL